MFYFNFDTGESASNPVGIREGIIQFLQLLKVWDHPCDEYHRMLYKKERAKKLAAQLMDRRPNIRNAFRVVSYVLMDTHVCDSSELLCLWLKAQKRNQQHLQLIII